MASVARLFWSIFGVVLLLLAGGVGLLWFVAPGQKTSELIDFHPAQFEAKAERAFFYSVGDDLKYSDAIDAGAPTLLHGLVGNFQVSPDGASLAVVVKGQLSVVSAGGVKAITPVESIYKEPKPIGKVFFRDHEFEWTGDGRYLYLIKDQFYPSKGSQLFSAKGELWRYEVATGKLEEVLKPFPADSYFFGKPGEVYFSRATPAGDLVLEYFDGKQVRDVPAANTARIPQSALPGGGSEELFHAFEWNRPEYELGQHGVQLVRGSDGTAELRAEARPVLRVSQGKGWEGSYFCVDLQRSAVVPGSRYLVLDVPYCGNYKGQLLVEMQTGRYKEPPKDVRVYTTLTTRIDPDYRITVGGIAEQ